MPNQTKSDHCTAGHGIALHHLAFEKQLVQFSLSEKEKTDGPEGYGQMETGEKQQEVGYGYAQKGALIMEKSHGRTGQAQGICFEMTASPCPKGAVCISSG